MKIETEFHFIMCCPKYRSIRLECFGNIAWPTPEKNQIFNVYEKKEFNYSTIKLYQGRFFC